MKLFQNFPGSFPGCLLPASPQSLLDGLGLPLSSFELRTRSVTDLGHCSRAAKPGPRATFLDRHPQPAGQPSSWAQVLLAQRTAWKGASPGFQSRSGTADCKSEQLAASRGGEEASTRTADSSFTAHTSGCRRRERKVKAPPLRSGSLGVGACLSTKGVVPPAELR